MGVLFDGRSGCFGSVVGCSYGSVYRFPVKKGDCVGLSHGELGLGQNILWGAARTGLLQDIIPRIPWSN